MFAKKSTVQITRDHNKKIVKIIQTLLTNQDSFLFRKPVPFKALGFDDYRQFIKKPIDLNLIRRQYNQNKYKTVEQVLDDIQLVWDNCIVYCKQDSEFYIQALKMQKPYHELIKELLPQFWKNIDINEEQIRRNNQKKQIRKLKEANLLNAMSKSKKQHQTPVQVILPVETQQKMEQEKLQKITQQKKKVKTGKQYEVIVAQEQVNSQIQQQNSQQKETQRQPILIKLNQHPSIQQLLQLNDWISQIQQKQNNQILSKVFQILYKYEREHLVSETNNQNMDFKMNNIHISTYYRIKKLLQQKLDITPIQSQPNGMMNGTHNQKPYYDLIE